MHVPDVNSNASVASPVSGSTSGTSSMSILIIILDLDPELTVIATVTPSIVTHHVTEAARLRALRARKKNKPSLKLVSSSTGPVQKIPPRTHMKFVSDGAGAVTYTRNLFVPGRQQILGDLTLSSMAEFVDLPPSPCPTIPDIFDDLPPEVSLDVLDEPKRKRTAGVSSRLDLGLE